MKVSGIFDKKTEDYFRKRGWLKERELVLGYGKAGEGNMNFVARVKTESRSFIVKQSRPYVEKYPQVPAPIERIEIEKNFYEITSSSDLISNFSPQLIDFDKHNFTLVMEDLGNGSDYLGLYSQELKLSKVQIQKLVDYLIELHALKPKNFPDNGKMKALNHEHIFNYPFLENNGFELDTVQQGLQELSLNYKRDESLKNAIDQLGERYLKGGTRLLHGDFYPGSWLKVGEKLKVIDPEFAFMGDPEFDLGVMLAHFKLASLEPSIQSFARDKYLSQSGIDEELLDKYIGVEILRRLIGLAQLPVNLSIKEKQTLCDHAAQLLLNN